MPATQPAPKNEINQISTIEAPRWTLAPEHTLTKRLLERKLTAETISYFEIAPYKNGWSYPAAGGTRWKNYDSNAEPKYTWLDGKPERAEIYHGPELARAITAAAGACWLVSGEPDVWALHSAGINHALSGFTEAHAPNELAFFLASLGVTVLYIAPDLDLAGERWARKIAAALASSPIELDCRALPAELGSKGDLGKAWQQYNKLMPFERWLTGLPRYYPEPEIERTEPANTSGGEHTAIPEDYRQEIISRLGVSAFGSSGFSKKRVLCLFHADHTPSASLHQFKGLYCHTEGTWHTWQEIGERLELGSIREWRASRAIATQSQQLTTELREALIKLGATSASRVIDALFSLGWTSGKVFSRAEAERALSGQISSWSVRAALEPVSTTDKRKTKSKDIYCGFFPPFSLQQCTKEKTHNKSKGRPSKLYIMPSLAQIAEIAGSKIGSHNDVIPAEKIADRAAYRAEVYAAPIRRKAGTYARKTLTERIGVSTRTGQSYDKRAALVVRERFNKEPIEIEKITEMESQPKQDKRRNYWLENGEIYAIGKYKGKPRRFVATLEGGLRALASSPNGELLLVTQLTNHYQAGADSLASQPRPEQALTPGEPVKAQPAQPSKAERELEAAQSSNGEKIISWEEIIAKRTQGVLQLYREYIGEPSADDIAWLKRECLKDKEQMIDIEAAIKNKPRNIRAYLKAIIKAMHERQIIEIFGQQ